MPHIACFDYLLCPLAIFEQTDFLKQLFHGSEDFAQFGIPHRRPRHQHHVASLPYPAAQEPHSLSEQPLRAVSGHGFPELCTG